MAEAADDRAGFEALERRFDVRRRARRDGADGVPATHADEASRTERMIIDYLQAQRARFIEQRAAIAARAERDLRRTFEHDAESAELALAGLSLRGAAARTEYSAELRAAQAAQAALDAFQEKNEIPRPARYPDSMALAVALMAGAAALEASFSAALFSDVDALGLIGGASKAIGLSGANVLLGFFAGYLGLRYLQARPAPLRALGLASFALFALIAVGLNVYAASWREDLAKREIDAAAAQAELKATARFEACRERALAKAGQDPLAARAPIAACQQAFFAASDAARPPQTARFLIFSSPQAVILLMLGGGVWVFAALKGYSGVDDPIPEFGKLDRAAKEAQAALDEARAEAGEILHAPVKGAFAAGEREIAAFAKAQAERRRIHDRAADEIADFDARWRRAAGHAEALLALYRQENTAARATAPPARFADPPTLEERLPDVLEKASALFEDGQARGKARLAAVTAALHALEDARGAASKKLDGTA